MKETGDDTYGLVTQKFRDSKQSLRSYAYAKRSKVDEGSLRSESLGTPREPILCLLGVDN